MAKKKMEPKITSVPLVVVFKEHHCEQNYANDGCPFLNDYYSKCNLFQQALKHTETYEGTIFLRCNECEESFKAY